MRRVGFDLLAQPPNQHVNGPVVGRPFLVLDHVEQPVAAQHHAGVVGEGREQFVFGPREAFDRAVRVAEPPAGSVEGPRSELRGCRCVMFRRRLPQGSDPSRKILDTREKLALVKRLGYVVVGAQFEPDDPVNLVGAACEQDDPGL